MGRKDLTGKDYFAEWERFAELLNFTFYEGENVVQKEDLSQVVRVYPSLRGTGEMGRDIFMKDKERNVYYGLELETESDYSMPERVMVYDACELEQQIWEIGRKHKEERKFGEDAAPESYREKKSRMGEGDFLQPVITFVLYLGTGHFEGRKRLLELFDVPVKTAAMLEGKIPDYDFPLLEADYINLDYFRTDLKEFFQAMQCRGNKEKLNALFHSESFLRLKEDAARAIAAHLGWKRLTIKAAKEKEGFVLCKALEELMEDARTAGRREGQASGMSKGERKGKKEERISIIRNMQREGMDRALIVKLTGCTSKEFALAAER